MSAESPASPQPGSTLRLEASRWAWLVPVGIIAGALGLRLAGVDKSLWIDEASTVRHIRAADFIGSLRTDIHPPLYFFLLKAVQQVTSSFTGLRLLSAACGVGTVAALCFFFRDRHRPAGWIAGLLVAALPGFTANSQELRQYALLSLALGFALFFAWRLLHSPRNTPALAGLTIALAAAAATHLLTVFFLGALALTLGWQWRHEWRAACLRITCALAPAGCLILLFKSVFLLPDLQPAQWWMPPVSLPMLARIFSEASGWSAILWVADACERHLSHTGIVVIAVMALGAAFVCWIAWARRQAGGAHFFLAVALLYWGAMVGYSLVALPVLWPRTALPGMLPFALALGLGITTHPSARGRALATAAVVVLAFTMTVPWLRGLAFRPNEDLRGFSHSLQSTARPGSLLILLGEVEIGIEPYWPEYRQARLLRLKLGEPQTLADVTAALGRQPPGENTLLIYRADFYLTEKQATLDALVSHISAAVSPPETVWAQDGYHILQFAPAKRNP
jgi:hypothetical protein